MLAHKSFPAQDFMGVNKVDGRGSKKQPDWRDCWSAAVYTKISCRILNFLHYHPCPHQVLPQFLNLPKTSRIGNVRHIY